MAAFNVTLDDSSPLITYSPAGAWADSTNGTAPASQYSSSSYHVTQAPAATASITFNGTGVWFTGAHLPAYGAYQLAVDGRTVQTGNAGGAPQLNATLAGVSGLAPGQHTAVLTSFGAGLDIDTVTFEAQIGSAAGAAVSSQIVDDVSSDIAYTPNGAWNVNSNAAFENGTLHFTNVGSAQATYAFAGEAFAIYGTTSPDHGSFTVAIDGGQATVAPFSGVTQLHSQNLLYFTSLSPGQHTVVLTANPGLSGTTQRFVDVDYYEVYTTAAATNNGGAGAVSPASSGAPGSATTISTGAPSATSAGASAPTDSAADHDGSHGRHKAEGFAAASKPPTGAIIGGVLGALVVLILVVLGLLFCLRRRRQAEQRKSFAGGMPATPALPWQFAPGGSPVDTEKALPPPTVVVPTYAALPPRAPGAVRFDPLARTDSGASDAPLLAHPYAQAPAPAPLPRAPPPSAMKQTPSRAGVVARGGPIRPVRPPSLQLTVVDTPAPSAAPVRPARPADPHLSVLHDRRVPTGPAPALPVTRPSRPSSPHLSEIDQPVPKPGTSTASKPARPTRPETFGIIDLYAR